MHSVKAMRMDRKGVEALSAFKFMVRAVTSISSAGFFVCNFLPAQRGVLLLCPLLSQPKVRDVDSATGGSGRLRVERYGSCELLLLARFGLWHSSKLWSPKPASAAAVKHNLLGKVVHAALTTNELKL